MSAVPALPPEILTLADARALHAAARRAETPCGEGRMVWHLWGEASATHPTPVVLVHGGSGSWNHWVRNIAALVRAGRRVLVPDLPGFGDSAAPPRGQDADVLPPFVEAGLQALVGDTACDLVAFSFGGMVCGFLAAQHPRRVRSLVLSGSPALTPDGRPPLDLKSWSHLPPGAERDEVLRHNLLSLMLAHAHSLDEVALTLHAENLVRDRMKLRRLSRTDVLLRTLPEVRCPVFGLYGALDRLYLGRTEVIAPALARAPGFGGLTMVPDAGHWVQFEAAAAYDAALHGLLGRVDGREG
jgi:pimeloyl-ACP methyl ester carboxylesterase